MSEDDRRTEIAIRETRARNYLDKCHQRRTDKAEAVVFKLCMTMYFISGAMVGALVWNILLQLAGRL